MATLAFISEDKESKFDVVHMGEDLTFLPDGYVYLSTHMVLKADDNCTPFTTFQIAYHGNISDLTDSKFIRNSILMSDEITFKNHKFAIYNESFLDKNHPSNVGFEGGDFSCKGRKVSFDGYFDINVPKDDEFDIKLVDNDDSYGLIRFEFNNEIKSGYKFCLRIGFLFEPTSGRVKRFFMFPPEINHFFHFYTKKSLGENAISFLNEAERDEKIMNVRIRSPSSISTCDFYFRVRNEYIEGLLAPTRNARMSFSKEDNPNGDFLNYHMYLDDMPYMIPSNELCDGDESKQIQFLKFDNNNPLLLRIDRTDRSIFYSIVPTFLAIFSVFVGINIEYNIEFRMWGLVILSIIVTIITIILMNQVFAKTKNIN